MIRNNFGVDKLAELEIYCREFDCSQRQAMEEMLIVFYEAAGFWTDVLESEIRSTSDEMLMEAYLNL